MKMTKKVLILILVMALTVLQVPTVAFSTGDGTVDNLTVLQPENTEDHNSLIVKWDEYPAAETYTISYERKSGGVSDPETADNVAWSADGYTLTGLAECSRYDITVTPDVDEGEPAYALGVTRCSDPAFDLIPTDSFSGSTTPSRYYSFPGADLNSSDTFSIVYELEDEIMIGENSVFRWYMQTGFNSTDAGDHVKSFRLFDLTEGEEIELDYGEADFGSGTASWPAVTDVTDGTFSVTNQIISGDFEVSKLDAGGKTWIRFAVNIDGYLEEEHVYSLEIDPSFHTGGNNPSRLNKVYMYQLETTVNSPGGTEDETAPVFPADFTIDAYKDDASGATVMWSDATDNIGVVLYKLYSEDGTLIASITDGSNSYSLTGLVAGTTNTYYIKAYDAAGNESEASITISFDIESLQEYPESTEPFIVKVSNVTSGDKDVSVDTEFIIISAEPIELNADITEGRAIKLLEKGTTEKPADYTLSSDGKVLTVIPAADLKPGTEYTLSVTDMVKNVSVTLAALPSEVTFSTRVFSGVSATATAEGDGMDISLSLTNDTNKNKNVVIKYVVRRGKGARPEAGGTIVAYGESQNEVPASIGTNISIPVSDITKDAYGEAITGKTYADVYLTNNNGQLLSEPIHLTVTE